ncbi:MAG: alpha-2,3-sialyltransferase [Pasteurella oralis]|uniref:alpha-2,3-sialyltransferase n=1 Tax=Pasteurella oralis TaxID=1071947 RepID=UPI0026F7EE00|nr:alpha-2,3-sialyltransferase [Pasteurella oralis]
MDGVERSRECKSVVVAGNGASLTQVDYSLLPVNYDVFRCNQFYFEDHYFLGKKIKAAFFTPGVLLEQYYTLYHLRKNNEYSVDKIILSSFNHPTVDLSKSENIKKLFIDVINGYEEYLSKLSDFDIYLRYKELYESQRITSGIYMCAVAIAMGYTDIYLTGIDFYESNSKSYAFEPKKTNIISLLPDFKNISSKFHYHNKDADLEALYFLQKNYGVNFYSISPGSLLSEHFPTSTKNISSQTNLIPVKKENYINDILLPPDFVYEKLGFVSSKKERLNANLIFRIIKDFIKLPSAIKHYLREK